MTKEAYMQASSESAIFNLRLLKDFATITAYGLVLCEQKYIQPLIRHGINCENLLKDYLETGSALPGKKLREAGAFVTQYTLECEANIQKLCSKPVDTKTTRAHIELNQNPDPIPIGKLPEVYSKIFALNQKAVAEAKELFLLFTSILTDRLGGKIFCYVLPSALALFAKTAKSFFEDLEKIEQNILPARQIPADAQTLKDCLAITKNLIDPSEEHEITRANNLIDKLQGYASGALTDRFYTLSHQACRYFLNVTQKLLVDELKNIMPPILADSFLRVANLINASASMEDFSVQTLSEIVSAPAVQ